MGTENKARCPADIWPNVFYCNSQGLQQQKMKTPVCDLHAWGRWQVFLNPQMIWKDNA